MSALAIPQFGPRVVLINLAIFVYLGLKVNSCMGIITVNPSDTTTFEGSNVSLQCVIAIPIGTKTETCYWLKDGAIISIDNYTGIYAWIGDFRNGNCSIEIIGVANDRDAGRWSCQIPPSPDYSGDISRTAGLTVFVKPTPPTIYYKEAEIPFGDKIVIKQNDSVEIKCVSRHGNPPSKLSWSLNGSRLDTDKDEMSSEMDKPKTYRSTIILKRKFNREINGKILRCTLEHVSLNASIKYDVIMDVLYSTTTVDVALPSYVEVDEGQHYVFPCKANGNPFARCEWMTKKDGLKNDGQQHWIVKTDDCDYVIESASSEDQGQYMCLAGNGQLIPSQEITFKLRRTRDISGLIGILIGGLFLVALIILIVVIYFLRRKVIKETRQLPTREHLDHASTMKLVVDRTLGLEHDLGLYMVPLQSLEEEPLNTIVQTDDNQLLHHVYADPHIYENINAGNKKEIESEIEDHGYIEL